MINNRLKSPTLFGNFIGALILKFVKFLFQSHLHRAFIFSLILLFCRLNHWFSQTLQVFDFLKLCWKMYCQRLYLILEVYHPWNYCFSHCFCNLRIYNFRCKEYWHWNIHNIFSNKMIFCSYMTSPSFLWTFCLNLRTFKFPRRFDSQDYFDE